MKLATHILVCLLFASTSAMAHFRSGANLYGEAKNYLAITKNSSDLARIDQAAFSGYVTGVVDAISLLRDCMPNGVTVGQMSSIAAKYIVAHDEIRHQSGNKLVTLSLIEAFPACRGTFAPEKKP